MVSYGKEKVILAEIMCQTPITIGLVNDFLVHSRSSPSISIA